MIQKVQFKKITAVFVLVTICLSLVSCASAPSVSTETVSQPLETENYPIPAGREPVPLDGKKLTIGIWCGTHHDFFFATMMLLKEAGIDQIIGPDDLWTGEDGMLEMLDRAEQFGISVIPNLRGWDLNEVEELEAEFNVLLQQPDSAAKNAERFGSIANEMASLKEQREKIAARLRKDQAVQSHVQTMEAALEGMSHHMQQWDEEMIRQLVHTVKVISSDHIKVYLYDGTEIDQTVNP